MPAFCKAEYLAMLARAHVHNCMLPGNQGLGFEEGTTSSQVVSAHFFWSALCHPAAPALLQHLTAIVINFWELCNASGLHHLHVMYCLLQKHVLQVLSHLLRSCWHSLPFFALCLVLQGSPQECG